MTRARARHLLLGLAVACAAAAGCTGGSSDDATPPSPGGSVDDTVAPPAPPAVPDAPPAGTGAVVVGGSASTFEVTACHLEPDPAEPAGAQTMVRLEGTGTTSGGVPFTIEVQRFGTGTDVRTFTDTATYTDTARILQLQRIEVAGQVTDLRQPDASSALLRVRPDGVSLTGLASGPGEDREDGGLVGVALNATCG